MKCKQACDLFDQAQQDCDRFSASAENLRKNLPILEKTEGINERTLESVREAISDNDRLRQEAQDRMEELYPIMMAALSRTSRIIACASPIVAGLLFCLLFPLLGAIEFADGFLPQANSVMAFGLTFDALTRWLRQSGSGGNGWWLRGAAQIAILSVGICTLQSFGFLTILDPLWLVVSLIVTLVANKLVPPTVYTLF